MTEGGLSASHESGEWNLVESGGMAKYPCGAAAGERLRLRRRIVVKTHEGVPTGEVHEPGEMWTVLLGVASEPSVVWLREPSGDSHTWDDESLWEWFERA